MEISRRSRLGNYLISFFGDVCVRKTLTHYKGGFGWFKLFFLVCFFNGFLFWNEVFW